jgi:hypothetical protein
VFLSAWAGFGGGRGGFAYPLLTDRLWLKAKS